MTSKFVIALLRRAVKDDWEGEEMVAMNRCYYYPIQIDCNSYLFVSGEAVLAIYKDNEFE